MRKLGNDIIERVYFVIRVFNIVLFIRLKLLILPS